MKENREDAVSFSTAVYRKPTFTGQYTRWDSFSAKKYKINLIKCLTTRAMKICSPNKLQDELRQIRTIFDSNGYPTYVVEKVMAQVLSPKPRKYGPTPCPVFLRRPWIGTRPSEQLEAKVKRLVQWAYPMCQAKVCFSSTPLLKSGIKDRIPTHQLSNVIYLFECRCGSRYVGKTTQRLEARIKQHVPAVLTKTTRTPTSAIAEHLRRKTVCRENF